MKKLILSITALAVALASSAQLLWKVSGNGAKGESYLFGTHHIAPVALLDSIAGFNDALAGVSTVYGEVDMADMASPSVQQIVMGMSMAPADSTLSKVLTTAQLDSVNAVLAKYTAGALTVAAVDQMKPAVLDTQIGMFQNMTAFPEFTGQEQLDMTVQNRARAAGKAVGGFETLEQQLGFLMGDPVTEQVESLMESVRKDGVSIEKAKALAAAYLAGDLDSIAALINDPDMGMSPRLLDKMIISRNNEWLARLKEILPADNVMVVVGVGHLAGEHGLIKLLRDAGYSVTPVK